MYRAGQANQKPITGMPFHLYKRVRKVVYVQNFAVRKCVGAGETPFILERLLFPQPAKYNLNRGRTDGGGAAWRLKS